MASLREGVRRAQREMEENEKIKKSARGCERTAAVVDYFKSRGTSSQLMTTVKE